MVTVGVNEKRYWSDFVKPHMPDFPSQRKVNSELQTKAAGYELEFPDANPLTVLLLMTYESMIQLGEYAREKSEFWRNQHSIVHNEANRMGLSQLQVSYIPALNSTASGVQGHYIDYKGMGSRAAMFNGWQTENDSYVKRLPEETAFYGIRAHLLVYSFLNSYATTLDRLANELALLYSRSLQINRPDWGTLFQGATPTKSRFDYSDPLMDSVLVRHQNHIDSIKLLRYRNIHTHEGYLKIQIQPEEATQTWRVCLPVDPDDARSAVNVDALTLMSSEFPRLLILTEEIYGHMASKISSSVPPW